MIDNFKYYHIKYNNLMSELDQNKNIKTNKNLKDFRWFDEK